jgi:hypothetical protein
MKADMDGYRTQYPGVEFKDIDVTDGKAMSEYHDSDIEPVGCVEGCP